MLCADGTDFGVVGRDAAEERFWDAVRRSRLNGVWVLYRPDGTAFVTVTAMRLDATLHGSKEERK